MYTAEQMEQMRDVDITTVDKNELVDIATLQIDAFAPIETRASAFFEQIKNPYAFRVGTTAVKIEFTPGGKPLHDSLLVYFTTLRQDC